MKKHRVSSRSLTVRICTAALFMAMNIALSSFGIPVPGGAVYLCDAVICLAAFLLDPVSAFCVGGIGSFLGDMIFYPATMFVSLLTHGIQAAVISLISHHILKKRPVLSSSIAAAAGAVIMVAGYVLGKTFIFSTFATALIEAPYDILQSCTGAVLAVVLCYPLGVKKLFDRTAGRYIDSKEEKQAGGGTDTDIEI